MSASAGKVLLTPKGDYNASTTYSILDWVRYNGAVYVAKQTTTGNLPTDTTYWSLMLNAPANLADLTDVDIDTTTLADGQTLVYNATTGKFENGASSGGVGKDLTGQTVEPTQGTTVTAGTNAEIFNDYRERQFNATTGKATQGNVASAMYSHAEGYLTTASGGASHAEGGLTVASGGDSHAEGSGTTASGSCSHAEGGSTTAYGRYGHAEGGSTTANSQYSHAEGESTVAGLAEKHITGGAACHAEGHETVASGMYGAHAEGRSATASGNASHAEGNSTTAGGGYGAHAEGYLTIASGDYGAHAEGRETTASGDYGAHAEGYLTIASGDGAHVSGYGYLEHPIEAPLVGHFVHGCRARAKELVSGEDTQEVIFGYASYLDVNNKTDLDATKGRCGQFTGGSYTQTLVLQQQAIYLLFVDTYTYSTGANRGASAYYIASGGLSSLSPTLIQLGTSGTPAEVSAISGANKISIKNGSSSYRTQYTLIRLM